MLYTIKLPQGGLSGSELEHFCDSVARSYVDDLAARKNREEQKEAEATNKEPIVPGDVLHFVGPCGPFKAMAVSPSESDSDNVEIDYDRGPDGDEIKIVRDKEPN